MKLSLEEFIETWIKEHEENIKLNQTWIKQNQEKINNYNEQIEDRVKAINDLKQQLVYLRNGKLLTKIEGK